jgi:hypothetical protein
MHVDNYPEIERINALGHGGTTSGGTTSRVTRFGVCGKVPGDRENQRVMTVWHT